MAIGPGAIQENIVAPEATLAGASEYEYITILNPLSDDFVVRVGQDVPVNMPFNIGRDISGKTSQTTLSERDAAQTYGLSLKNPDFQGRKHIYNDTVIKAGQTINLKGNEAQVAVKQIVDAIMQKEGKTRLLSDPTLRKEVEDRIIMHRGSIQDLMDNNFSSTRQQATEAVNKSNEVHNEQPFAGLNQQPDEEASDGSDNAREHSDAQAGRTKSPATKSK